jgi:GNAT superfamily N-acetyltransferase
LRRKQADVLNVRQYATTDEDPVVALSLRAWAPVFASMRGVLGDKLFLRLYPDWQAQQDQAVRDVLTGTTNTTWVAAVDGSSVGFVSATVHDEEGVGEIVMLAVDPAHQGKSLGVQLTETAVGWMRREGVDMAVVETGGDPGHAPARAVYTKAQFTALPVARFFRVL